MPLLSAMSLKPKRQYLKTRNGASLSDGLFPSVKIISLITNVTRAVAPCHNLWGCIVIGNKCVTSVAALFPFYSLTCKFQSHVCKMNHSKLGHLTFSNRGNFFFFLDAILFHPVTTASCPCLSLSLLTWFPLIYFITSSLNFVFGHGFRPPAVFFPQVRRGCSLLLPPPPS